MTLRCARFEISGTWDGGPLSAQEFAHVELRLDADRDEVTVVTEAAFFGDPKPDVPPGRLDGLWNFEVVELFLLGADQRYLELEFGPHGHHLALRFRGPRVADVDVLDLSFAVEERELTEGEIAGRWRGRATFAAEELPDGLFAANAYAIHGADGALGSDGRNHRAARVEHAQPQSGQGVGRRYLAMHPVPGNQPDFHRLDCFRRIEFR